MTEDEGTWTVSDKISVSDRDEGQSSFAEVTDLSGTHGDFTFNKATEDSSYTLRNGDNNVQALGATDHPTDTLRVYSLDGSASQDIEVTVKGAAEPLPVIVDLTPVIIFDVELSSFFEGLYQNFDFTSNDFIHFESGVTVQSNYVIRDFPEDPLSSRSTVFAVSYASDPDSLGGRVLLLGYTSLSHDQIT